MRSTTRSLLSGSILLISVALARAEQPAPAPPVLIEAVPSAGVEPVREVSPEPPTGDIQERAVIRDHRTQPGAFSPSAGAPPPSTKPFKPTPEPGMSHPGAVGGLPPVPGDAPPPSGVAPPPGIVGPTDNITKVARAITIKSKSLTMLAVVAPGQAITKPVTISILFGGYVPQRFTQDYVASTGNHFLYNDIEGDGKPRNSFATITLTEPKPGGGVYTLSIPGNVMLDPLYDVHIGPLQFSLLDNCDPIGLSEIRLQLDNPEGKHQEIAFLSKAGQSISFGQFVWARSEVSTGANLHNPSVSFYESDPKGPFDFPHGSLSPDVKLLPGKTETRQLNLKELSGGDCRAYAKYTITYALRWYPYL